VNNRFQVATARPKAFRGWQAVALVSLLVSCGAYSQTEPVRIGVVLPLSGHYAGDGREQAEGMRMAVEAAGNRLGSSGRKVELHGLDDECKADRAVEKARQLVDVERVAFLMGAPCQASAIAVASVAEQKKVPFLTTGSLNASSAMAYQFGPSREQLGRFAKQLSDKTGLKVDGLTACAWTYRPVVPAGVSAVVCPSLGIQESQWQQLARHRPNNRPGAALVVGFASMQIALEALKDRAEKPDQIATYLKSANFQTILGSVNLGKDGGAKATLRLRASSSANKSDVTKLASETKEDSCDECKKNGECPQGSYGSLRFSTADDDCCKKSKTAECPQGSLLFFHR
jgi:hypothetical protein